MIWGKNPNRNRRIAFSTRPLQPLCTANSHIAQPTNAQTNHSVWAQILLAYGNRTSVNDIEHTALGVAVGRFAVGG